MNYKPFNNYSRLFLMRDASLSPIKKVIFKNSELDLSIGR